MTEAQEGRERTIARVVVSAAPFVIDRPYDYLVPPELAELLSPGMRVMIPFGKGNRICEGFVLSLNRSEDPLPKGIKAVRTLLDEQPVLSREGIQLALWMRDRYFCTVYEAAMTMLPTGLWYVLRENYVLAPGFDREAAEQKLSHRRKECRILDLICAAGGRADLDQIKNIPELHNPRAALRELVREGFLEKETAARRKTGDKTETIAVLDQLPEDAMAKVTARRKSAPMRYAVTELLSHLHRASVKELRYFTGASMATIKGLAKSGIIRLEEQEVFRNEPVGPIETKPLSTLNQEQQNAFAGLSELLTSGAPQAALLYGVTGSGKTQVYLHLIQKVLDQGRGAIILVPEIALTPSLLHLFLEHFGSQVAVLHSCLSTGARYDEWKRVRDGLARVVIGTRSAVFAPMPDPGLIILDEEQESSYQSESMVRYHARDVAKYRCAQSHSLLLLGSATPAIESRYAAEIKQYHLFTLTQRYNTQALPSVCIADMKQELRQGNDTGLSHQLREELEENFRRGEQSILFLNRRGNSRMVVCSQCGASPVCPHCSVHLTYHSVNHRLMCHYCGHSEPVPDLCPECMGRLQFVGIGTQKLQEELETLYPDQEVLRMDADTISATQSHEVLLDRFRKKKIPILLGTQMVAKGLDFPNVTLVGVIDSDLSLYADHYRAAERTFSLITQVVGRAGRGERPGRAVLQTWTPDNDVINLAARQDYDQFYCEEREMRRMLCFPPFTDLFRIMAAGPEESQVLRLCAVLRRSLEPWVKQQKDAGKTAEILGPAPASVLKMKNRYRYCILIKCRSEKHTRAHFAQLLRTAQQDRVNRGISILMDVNPMD